MMRIKLSTRVEVVNHPNLSQVVARLNQPHPHIPRLESLDVAKHGNNQVALKMVLRVSTWEHAQDATRQALERVLLDAGVGAGSEYPAEIVLMFSIPIFSS